MLLSSSSSRAHRQTDPKSIIFGIIKDAAKSGTVPFVVLLENASIVTAPFSRRFFDPHRFPDLLRQIIVRGFSEELLRETIHDYEELGILSLASDGSAVHFITWDQEPSADPQPLPPQ